MAESASWSQPSLLESRCPVRLRFDVLVDPVDETAVVAYEAVQFPSRTLIALWSTSPVALSEVEATVREAAREFTALIREHTGPF